MIRNGGGIHNCSPSSSVWFSQFRGKILISKSKSERHGDWSVVETLGNNNVKLDESRRASVDRYASACCDFDL